VSAPSAWDTGRHAWGFEVPAAELDAAYQQLGLGSEADAAEVYLAVGCQLGIPAALHHFETQYLAVAVPLLRRQRTPADKIDDILQRLRELLLVARQGETRIGLMRYVGTGRLRSLVRVSAARAALRGTWREVAVESSDGILGELWSRSDPELHVMDAQLHDVFKRCFEQAAALLPDTERALLRLHFVEELSYQQIAMLFRVHRSTICRQLATARTRLLDGLVAGWQRATGEPLSLDLAALLDGELDLSLSRLLPRRSSS